MDIYYIVAEGAAGPGPERLTIWGEAFCFSNGRLAVMERRTGRVTTYGADDLFGPGQRPGVFGWRGPRLLWIRVTAVPDNHSDLHALIREGNVQSLADLEETAWRREELRSA